MDDDEQDELAQYRETMAARIREANPSDVCAVVIYRGGSFWFMSDVAMGDQKKGAALQAGVFEAAAKATRNVYGLA